MDDLDELERAEEKDGYIVEQEWKRVEAGLGQKQAEAWAIAVVEAHKIFRDVLSNVSFGQNLDEQIRNVEELFSNLPALMNAQVVWMRVMDEPGYRPNKTEAKKTCDSLMQAILDLIGRDFHGQSWWHRLNNGLNYFWGHHPRLLTWAIGTLLIVVVVTWFLTELAIGQWLVGLVVGFAQFVIERPGLFGSLVGVFLVVALVAWARDRR